jgi:RNA polymerase sigma factor (TIGR02999 family)
MAADVPMILREMSSRDPAAADRLLPIVYRELRALAEGLLARERTGHTLQPTALVHEAYLRLVGEREVRVHDKTHFFAVAAQAMRHVLVDHARRRGSRKRGGGAARVSVHTAVLAALESSAAGIDVLALHEALDRLAKVDSMAARVVELRFFGGLSGGEAATMLKISTSTAERAWRFARAWLRDELT